MAPLSVIIMPPDLRQTRRRIMQRRYATIREFAAALIRLVHYRDQDGRDIGFDYQYIRHAIIRRFPMVLRNGPHKNKLTRMSFHELSNLAWQMNHDGAKLPFRPKAKRMN